MSNISKNVHLIAHMHWDREWYFTTEQSRILLVNNMSEIMDMLEKNDNYPYYILDGQSAILEDFFEVKPKNRERVKKLVQLGKLIIGPWYTQTDEMVVGGESIVRNLLYGIKDCKEFGEVMMIGYLPDSFGQSEKLPQILNGFGIKRCVFWRGASQRHGTNKHNFYWESNSSGRVLVHLLPLGYAIGKYLPEDEEAIKKRLDKYLPVLDNGAVNDNIVLPNGHDQMPIQKNIFEVMDVLKKAYPNRDFFLSKYEHIFEELEKIDNLDTIKGELLDGKYMRVHRSIFSTRADIKSSNTRIENKITNILEPLMSIAYDLGVEYEHGLVESIWKEMLKNHAHDSIGCCCSDKVHKAIQNRFFTAEDKTDELINFYKRKISDSISSEKALDKLVVFNLLPYDRTCVVEGEIITKMSNFNLVTSSGEAIDYEIIKAEEIDAGLIDRQIVHYGDYDPFIKYRVVFYDTISSMGYKTYLIKPKQGKAKLCEFKSECQNEYYSITVNDNGSLNIYDKQKHRTYKNVLIIEDGADDGDEYDYSPLADDFIVTSQDVKAKIKVQSSENKSHISISYTVNIPKNLISRKTKVCDGSMDICMDITLKKNSPIIEVDIEIDNKANDHRVRAMIPSEEEFSGLIDFSISDNQFGDIKRSVKDKAMDIWEKEGWDERPDSIYPMLSYTSLAGGVGLALLTNSVREYEIVGKRFEIIAVTLFRSVGYLGKEELLRRPNRPSGIKLKTPDSQMIGKQKYSIAICSNSQKIPTVAKQYTTALTTYNKMPYNAMKLNPTNFTAPYEYSMFSISDQSFIMSALKKSECKSGLILRGYQSQNNLLSANISGKNIAGEVNLNEELFQSGDKKDFNDILLPKNEIKGYYIKLFTGDKGENL